MFLYPSGEKFMPNEVEVSPIFSTNKEAPHGAFSGFTTIGREVYAERS